MKSLISTIALLLVFSISALSQDIRFTPDRKLQYAEAIIANYYVEPVDRDTIVDEAIRAMLLTLDPHSAY